MVEALSCRGSPKLAPSIVSIPFPVHSLAVNEQSSVEDGKTNAAGKEGQRLSPLEGHFVLPFALLRSSSSSRSTSMYPASFETSTPASLSLVRLSFL